MHVVILVDVSRSMQFEDKLLRAQQLAAAFGIMGLFGVERVSAYAFKSETALPHRLPPCRGRASLLQMLAMVETIEGTGGDIFIDQALEAMLKHHSGRGVAVVLSDFLTFGNLPRALNRVFSAGLEVFGVQILGPSEIDPEVTGDMRLVDSETDSSLDVTAANDLLSIYKEHRIAYQENLASLCRQRSGRFLSICAADPVDWVIFDLFRRKGWVK
jgi:uncharacterized protein (DUF58 family)